MEHLFITIFCVISSYWLNDLRKSLIKKNLVKYVKMVYLYRLSIILVLFKLILLPKCCIYNRFLGILFATRWMLVLYFLAFFSALKEFWDLGAYWCNKTTQNPPRDWFGLFCDQRSFFGARLIQVQDWYNMRWWQTASSWLRWQCKQQ